jgi:FHA domain-containing protein
MSDEIGAKFGISGTVFAEIVHNAIVRRLNKCLRGIDHVFVSDMLEVYVLTFADEPFAQPLSAPIGREGVTIGRSSECVLHLPDPERHISRVQAKVESDVAGSLRVSNVSNANSIFVGDREIVPGEASVLAATDELRVGLFTLAVREASRPIADVFGVSVANAPHMRSSPASNSDAAPVKVTELTINSVRSAPPTIQTTSASANVTEPFLDLFPAENSAKVSHAPSFPPSGTTKPVRQVAAPSQPKSSSTAMPTQIPEDFDPFAMPSAASRNTGDPFSALQDHKDVSLRGLLDDSSSAHRLIDETPMKGNAPDFDPILGAETTGGAAGEVLDPLALFSSRAGTTGFDDIVPAKPYGTFLDRPTSELNALTKFASPKVKPPPALTASPVNELLDPLAAFGGNLGDPIDRVLTNPHLARLALLDSSPSAKEAKVESPRLAPHAVAPEITKLQKKVEPPVSPVATAFEAINPPPPVPSAAPIEKKTTTKAANNEHLLQALLDGIGIPSLELQGGLDEAMMRKIGEILRVSFDGTVEMMIARAMTKREVRTDVTMILAEKNNPIKFAPDGRAAIMQLLGKPFPGFMTHDDAIRDAYEDLRAHEVGVLAGMRAALKAVLNRFDPTSLEKKITSRSSLESVLPHLRKARLWDLYTEMSSQILAEAEDEFQSLFGKAFREVYEAEVEKVKQGRRQT